MENVINNPIGMHSNTTSTYFLSSIIYIYILLLLIIRYIISYLLHVILFII